MSVAVCIKICQKRLKSYQSAVQPALMSFPLNIFKPKVIKSIIFNIWGITLCVVAHLKGPLRAHLTFQTVKTGM